MGGPLRVSNDRPSCYPIPTFYPMNSKRLSLALPLISISLVVAGMTQRAFAAAPRAEVKSAITGISAIEKIQDRVANRAAFRKSEEALKSAEKAISAILRERPSMRRSSSSSSKSSSRSSRKSPAQSSSTEATLRAAAPEAEETVTAKLGKPSNDINAEIFRMVNELRAAEGLPAYTYNNTLEESATAYAVHMRSEDCFSHSDCGSTLKERMHASGYYRDNGRSYSYGENIARGQDTVANVMEDWMNSPPHKGAILSTKFKEFGIGRSGEYWVQHFGAVR